MATDADLLAASLEGKTHAFAELVERHQSAVCAVSYANTGDNSISEDVAQEAFVAAWRTLDTLRDPGRFKSWVCGIARNLASKARRASSRIGPETEVADAQPSAEDALDHARQEAAVWAALEALSATYREPLVLFYREGRSTKEVAEALALSVPSVEQRLSRGRKQLREEMAARVERSLEAQRPPKKISAGVVAAIHAGGIPVGNATPSTPSTEGITMKTALFGLAAAGALGLGGYGAYTTTVDREPGDVEATAVADAAKRGGSDVNGAQQRREQVRERELAARDGDTEIAAAVPSPRVANTSASATEPLQVKQIGPRHVGVKLTGGLSAVSGAPTLRETDTPVPTGSRRGQVVDTNGAGVSGAVVISGKRLSLMFDDTVSGQDAVVTDEEGYFSLPTYAGESPYIFAAHHDAGMAPFEPLDTSDHDSLILQLKPPSRITGRVLEGDAGVPARVGLQLASAITILVTTADDGSYRSPPLPAGPYDATAQLNVRDSQGSASFSRVRLRLPEGKDLSHDFITDEGALIVVEVPAPDREDLLTLEYDLLPGKVTVSSFPALKTLRADDPEIKGRWILFGGIDLDAQMQFHGVQAGPYTVCATAKFEGESRSLQCTQVEVSEDESVIAKLDPVGKMVGSP